MFYCVVDIAKNGKCFSFSGEISESENLAIMDFEKKFCDGTGCRVVGLELCKTKKESQRIAERRNISAKDSGKFYEFI